MTSDNGDSTSARGEPTTAASAGIGWLSTTRAAERLGITPRTLYRLIDEGQLAGYRLGRVIRIREADIDPFLEAHRITPGTLGHLYPGGDSVEEHLG
jgi:excisionase family DNA binding protein